MCDNYDNQIVDIAKSKLLEIYNGIFYDWKDEFKRTYEKEIFSEEPLMRIMHSIK